MSRIASACAVHSSLGLPWSTIQNARRVMARRSSRIRSRRDPAGTSSENEDKNPRLNHRPVSRRVDLRECQRVLDFRPAAELL